MQKHLGCKKAWPSKGESIRLSTTRVDIRVLDQGLAYIANTLLIYIAVYMTSLSIG